MAHPATHEDFTHLTQSHSERLEEVKAAPVRQARLALQTAFVAAPIVAGLDKFFHYLVDWNQYLAPQVTSMMGGDASGFMAVVGIIEIAVGFGVAVRPRFFAYVVSLWLLFIIMNLFMAGGYYDIALRDFGLSLAAFALGRLSSILDDSNKRYRLSP